MENIVALHRILILDDDGDYRKLLVTWLSNQLEDVEVVEYDPQSQGMPDADFDWSAFDVLLLDYNLQLDNATGLDILQANQDNRMFPATIMLTSAGSEDVAVRALKSGVADYLRKERLDKHQLKTAVEAAFAHQLTKRQSIYTLDEARQVAKQESIKVIREFKKKFEEVRELEEKHLRLERQKMELELQKNQEMLAKFEQERQKADVTKLELIAELDKLKARQSSAAEDSKLNKKLITTQQLLEQTNAGIDRIEQDYEHTKAVVTKNKWKQEQSTEMQQQLEEELTGFKEEMDEQEKQLSDIHTKIETRLRVQDNLAQNKKINIKRKNQSLVDDISSQLDKEDD